MRTFIAIDLTADMRREVARAQARLIQTCPASGIRWTDPRQCHLTLKFLGEIADDRVAAVSAALDALAAECRPFEMTIRGLGAFPPRGPIRVVWIGIEDPDGALVDCHARCETLLEPIGYPREARAFSPHLTLARIKDARRSHAGRRIIERSGPIDLSSQPVKKIVFYRSSPTPTGPVYTPISTHKLVGE